MANNIDLGTFINADMYYDYTYDTLKGTKGNSNTLRHTCVDNVLAPTARTYLPQEPSEEEEETRGLGGVMGVNGVRLNPHVKYDRISVQMGNYRINGDRQRYRRSNVYVSLRESTEQNFNVFLTGAATNAKAEWYRGAKNSQAVRDVIDALHSKYPDIMIARLRYKPTDGFITDFHKKNTKSAILGLHQNTDGDFIATLVLYYELIEIPLITPLSEKQVGLYYAHGVYDDYTEFDDEE
jgi:hypothetical protein